MLKVVITREGPFYVSECPELGVGSFGHNEQEARENLADAIEVYLKTLEDLESDSLGKNMRKASLAPRFNRKEWFTIVVALILFLISAIVGLYVRFSNPDLTETRLLLAFWPIWLGGTVTVLVAYGLWMSAYRS